MDPLNDRNDPGPTVVRLGVDVGQRQDYTALVVAEEVRRTG
jgi:hypothetical protein